DEILVREHGRPVRAPVAIVLEFPDVHELIDHPRVGDEIPDEVLVVATLLRESRSEALYRFSSRFLNATNYPLTTTINGLSFSALLWTTNAFAVVLALSLRARWTSSAGANPASPLFKSVAPLSSLFTLPLSSQTVGRSFGPRGLCPRAGGARPPT